MLRSFLLTFEFLAASVPSEVPAEPWSPRFGFSLHGMGFNSVCGVRTRVLEPYRPSSLLLCSLIAIAARQHFPRNKTCPRRDCIRCTRVGVLEYDRAAAVRQHKQHYAAEGQCAGALRRIPKGHR